MIQPQLGKKLEGWQQALSLSLNDRKTHNHKAVKGVTVKDCPRCEEIDDGSSRDS